MYAMRRWTVRNSRNLERIYRQFERYLIRCHPFFTRIGYDRVEVVVRPLERWIKGRLFDCQMCGECVLSSTGMVCPMNCPKQLRNGPCGGVRQDGRCEVLPDMPCVWVEAERGSRNMRYGATIQWVQPPVDNRFKGVSSFLRVARGEHRAAAEIADL